MIMWEQAKILMLKLLELLYSLTNSWGLAIILLTVLVRIAIHPLTQRQMSSMQKMQKLQPMMKVLQDKYGDDKETLNREMMALYKEHKVSPASGCLPLLIQLPIAQMTHIKLHLYHSFQHMVPIFRIQIPQAVVVVPINRTY